MMLLAVVLIQTVQPPHHRSSDNRNYNGNPPVHARSHPSTSDRLRIVAVNLSVANGFLLAFLNGGTMEVFLTMGESKTDSTDMAFETD
jgi:hypothetical protein